MVAAGSGERFGGLKQLAPLGDKTALEWSVRVAAVSCEQVVVVLPAAVHSDAAHSDAGADFSALLPVLTELGVTVATGGETRLASVMAGLMQLRPEIEVVVVHDAVRPGATKKMFEDVVAAVKCGADAAIPTLPVFDTLKRVAPASPAHDRVPISRVPISRVPISRVIETIDRSEIALAQTPQAFSRAVLTAAHQKVASTKAESTTAGESVFTDDASLVENLGGTVVAVAGDPAAHKITTPADLVVVAALMQLSADQLAQP